MNLTTISLALNGAIGFAVWQSALPQIAKIVLTVILCGKFLLFVYTAWMVNGGRGRNISAIALGVLNTAIIVYSLFLKEYHIAVAAAMTLVLFIVWALAVIFDLSFNRDTEK